MNTLGTKNQLVYTIREWESLTEDDLFNFTNNKKDAKKDFESLFGFLDAETGKSPFIRYNHIKKQFMFTHNKVGVISLPSGTVLEILPKIGEEEEARSLLVKMVTLYWQAKKVIPRQQSSAAELIHNNPLELLIYLFLQQCSILIKRGLAREYHDYERALPYIKGKINFAKQAIQAVAIPVHLRFQEFEINRPENRLLKSCLIVVNQLSRDSNNRLLAEKLLMFFEDVSCSTNIEEDINLWTRKGGRDLFHYRVIKPLVELLLRKLNPSPIYKNNKLIPYCLLFSMDELFELYIEYHFKQAGIKVEAQQSSEKFISYKNDELFSLKPDFLLYPTGSPRIVADAKWKVLSKSDLDKDHYYGIKREDLYQLFAYIRYYASESLQGLLIYPWNEEFQEIREVKYVHAGEKLFLVPFNCLEPGESIVRLQNYWGI